MNEVLVLRQTNNAHSVVAKKIVTYESRENMIVFDLPQGGVIEHEYKIPKADGTPRIPHESAILPPGMYASTVQHEFNPFTGGIGETYD